MWYNWGMNIKLSNNKVSVVDKEDYYKFNSYKWHFTHGYARSDAGGKKTYLHRVIMNAPQGKVVDHINGDTLDNRKSNLRIISHQDNIENRTKLNKNNKSGFRGVYLETRTGKWVAKYKVNYKNIQIGKYNTKEEAIIAYTKNKPTFKND